MERSPTFSSTEVVAVALAAASALGGIVIGLSRAQANAAREQLLVSRAAEANAASRLNQAFGRVRQASVTPSLPSPQLKQTATELTSRFNESARPALERLVETAVSQAETTRTGGVALRGKLHDAAETLTPLASDVVTVVKERVDRAAERTTDVAPAVVTRTASAADRAASRSTALVKDSAATAGWLAAAMVLIYYVILTPERRGQLGEAIATASEQIRLLIQDFQGYEEEL